MQRFALGILIVMSVGLAGCGAEHAPAAAGQGPPAVHHVDGTVHLTPGSRRFITVEPARVVSGAAALRVPGKLIFRDGAISEVGSPMAGRVTQLLVNVGDHVLQGAPLIGIRSPDAASARAQMSTSLQQLAAARMVRDRAVRMLEQGVGTEAEKLSAEVHVAELEAEVARARTTVSFVGGGAGGDVILRSPIAGTVISRNATLGGSVEPDGPAVIEIGDPNAILVEASVFERDVALVHDGASAHIQLTGIEAAIDGRVVAVGATVDNELRTMNVRIALDHAPAGLRPGMFGRVAIDSAEAGITLPSQAIVIRDGSTYAVYIDNGDGSFTRRAVQVGQSIDGRVQVLSGLQAGERVVVSGALLLDGEADLLI
ncbi:MAG: efflux RND transporter periplasmic adaptor subunit [Sandaracinaceae bacterium]|nr:efflux RND transporter periplasmic adaptor subunit [Sandaracinaceae bacterium]